MTYAFHPDAAAEYLEAIAYYEDRRAGLGATFIAEFEHIVARVVEAPDRYPIARAPDVRRTRLRRFPFALLFRRLGDGIQVLAVAHDRRRPAYWQNRP